MVSTVGLVDIDTMKVIEDRFNRTTIIPHDTRKLTFIAENSGRTAFASFVLNEQFLRTEWLEPYTAFGDKCGVYDRLTSPV